MIIRIVFDVSVKIYGIFLNNYILLGFKLLINLFGVFFCICYFLLVVVCVISEMYLQICILFEDYLKFRFFWRSLIVNGDFDVYEF